MASEGPLNPGTLADDSAVGTLTWSNPGNAASSNNSYATVAHSGMDLSHYLKATNFGFAIPAGATIDGIVVSIERKETAASSVQDQEVKIVKGGTVGSTNKANTAINWPTSDTAASYGGSSDLWDETWTPDDINAADFGVVLSTDGQFSGGTGSVDHITITVHYTPAATGNPWNAYAQQ